MGDTDTLSVKMALSGMDAARAQFEAFGHTVEHSMGGAKESFMEFAKELAAPLLAAGTAAGIALLGERFREMNLQIEKGMKITGLGAEELAGMGYAAQKSDISLDALEHSMRHLSEWMVRTGQSGRNVKEVLLEQAALFKSMPDGMAKLNMAQERFGRGGMEMIQMLDKGPQELEAMFERGGKLSGINEQTIQSARQFADALIDFKLAAESLAGTLQNTFIPTLNKMLKGVTDLIVKFREWNNTSANLGAAKEGAGIAGGLAAGALGVNAGANLMSKTFGFGALTSVKDFTAAISLMAQSLARMLRPIAVFILTAVSVTELFIQMHRATTAQRQESESALRLTERNKELAASLLKLIDAREAEGKLTKEQAADMRNGVGSKNPSSAYMSRMADSLIPHVLMQGVALAFHALMMALGLAQTTAAVANRATVTASSVSASTTEAAAAAPNALLHSIETFGVAALVGAAAFAVAMAAAGKFDQGGYTGAGGAQEPAGIVHKGEFVFDQASVARIGLGNLQAMHEGGAGGYMKQVGGGGDIHNHFWAHDQGREMQHFISTHDGVRHQIVDLMKRESHQILPRR
jgi:hypothetical protein